MEKKLFFKLYNISKKNKSINNFCIKITNTSKPIFFCIYILIIIYLLLSNNNKILINFLISPIALIIFNNILRFIFKRPRPFIKYNLNISTIKNLSYSFPSNHASVSILLSIYCFYINQILGIILIIFSILIGLSRIFIGFHYISDVILGWTLGCFFYFLDFTIF